MCGNVSLVKVTCRNKLEDRLQQNEAVLERSLKGDLAGHIYFGRQGELLPVFEQKWHDYVYTRGKHLGGS